MPDWPLRLLCHPSPNWTFGFRTYFGFGLGGLNLTIFYLKSKQSMFVVIGSGRQEVLSLRLLLLSLHPQLGLTQVLDPADLDLGISDWVFQ